MRRAISRSRRYGRPLLVIALAVALVLPPQTSLVEPGAAKAEPVTIAAVSTGTMVLLFLAGTALFFAFSYQTNPYFQEMVDDTAAYVGEQIVELPFTQEEKVAFWIWFQEMCRMVAEQVDVDPDILENVFDLEIPIPPFQFFSEQDLLQESIRLGTLFALIEQGLSPLQRTSFIEALDKVQKCLKDQGVTKLLKGAAGFYGYPLSNFAAGATNLFWGRSSKTKARKVIQLSLGFASWAHGAMVALGFFRRGNHLIRVASPCFTRGTLPYVLPDVWRVAAVGSRLVKPSLIMLAAPLLAGSLLWGLEKRTLREEPIPDSKGEGKEENKEEDKE